MMRYAEIYGTIYNNQRVVIQPTNNWQNGCVKCQVSWEDGCVDFIWFEQKDTDLVCTLNDRIRVHTDKEAV